MTTCREARPLLPLFFDGELEARQMRAVALHSTRCPECEHELRSLEHLQEAVVAHVDALVDGIDFGRVWAGIEPRLKGRAPAFGERLRGWWEEHATGWGLRGPAFAGFAAAALLALVIVQPGSDDKIAPPNTVAKRLEKIDNSVKFDSMQSSVDSVAMVTDAETNTTMLWIMDDAAGAIGHADDVGALE